MPLLDHFHPPLRGPRRWEGFHHAWATYLAQQLNCETLPEGFFAESEMSVEVDFAHLQTCEVRVYQDLGDAELRAAIELVSPAKKDRDLSQRTFAVKCASYLKNGIGLIVVDVVTNRSANFHQQILELLQAPAQYATWRPESGLYAAAYRPVTVRPRPRVEAWPRPLALGETLPEMPLWLTLDLCVPVRLEESYLTTCQGLRIPTP